MKLAVTSESVRPILKPSVLGIFDVPWNIMETECWHCHKSIYRPQKPIFRHIRWHNTTKNVDFIEQLIFDHHLGRHIVLRHVSWKPLVWKVRVGDKSFLRPQKPIFRHTTQLNWHKNGDFMAQINFWRPSWTPSWISQNPQWCQLGIIQFRNLWTFP